MPDHHHHKDHEHSHEKQTCTSCSQDDSPECATCAHEGETCTTCEHDHEHSHDGVGWNNTIIIGLAIVTGIVLEYLGVGGALPKLILVASMLASGYKMAISGFKGLMRGTIGIDLLVTIAAIGATAIGQYSEGALVVFLKDISMKLEVIAGERARHAIEALMELRPEVATIRKNGEEVTISVEQILPGEVFIVRPGDRLPLDGVVIEGDTTVDQSAMTGESMPIHKGLNDEVYAGTINLDGYLAVRTKRGSSESMLSNILRMVEEAEGRRSPTETLVNRFARYYTPAIIVLAILFATVPPLVLGSPWIPSIYNSLVLLVIGCPCALTIATPVAMVSAITSASRNGVLIKGSAFIEKINKAKVYAFDKTGTLTVGRPEVTDIIPFDVEKDEVLAIASALEENSKHPIANAIKNKATEYKMPHYTAEEFLSSTGRGVEAKINGVKYRIGNQRLYDERDLRYPVEAINELETQGKTVIILSREDKVMGLIALMDQGRATAKQAVRELRRQGMKVEMLTGDNETTAAAIAEQVGFNGYHANLLPEEKLKIIEELKQHGQVVMVGDGVNDAPALAAADVGVAMGGLGSDIALETADIVLLEDDLTRLVYLQRLSRTTLSRIRENITISVVMKLAIVILAAFGVISLWVSVVLGDVGLALLVILNSIRISGVKPISLSKE
ncbi:heavy metal translocating P-type ATPase [Candidatus Bathyarchaeota archaeon]|nr:MAG: heavy metal translocating P-type ATPase [Candidatus Bathyarchaeota archaeon]